MSATPIPRSLALALYGTTAISYLRRPPQIKSSRTTTVLPFTEEGVAYDAVRAALSRGEQAYVVCPLIGIPTKDLLASDEEESEDEQIEYALVEFGLESDAFNTETAGSGQASRFTAAEQHAEILQGQVFPSARVALLHGRLAAEEKSAIMEAFRAGEIDVARFDHDHRSGHRCSQCYGHDHRRCRPLRSCAASSIARSCRTRRKARSSLSRHAFEGAGGT